MDAEPVLVERACGGWLALSPPGYSIRIGVTAITNVEARLRWHDSIARWKRDLQSKGPTPPSATETE